MSTNRGIFESFPSQAPDKLESPFAVATSDVSGAQAASPFTAAAPQESPFRVVDEPAAGSPDFGKPVKLPDRRRLDSPFQVAEPSEGFAFEAAPAAAASPFEPAAASPFEPAASAPASPFSAAPGAPPKSASPATQAAIAAFSQWQEPTSPPPSTPFAPAPATPVQIPSAFAPPAQPTPPPAAAVASPAATPAPSPAPAPAAARQPEQDDASSDSSSIRQLELRAIFGVDREMSAEEILQRSRALPGIKNIARVGTQEIAVIESLKSMLPKLGFGSGALKIYLGSVPLNFIREGTVLLAVQTDGGFAPGVRETLMIVARELNRMG